MSEQKTDWKERECGAIWAKESASGNKYSSGYVTVNGEKVQIMIMRNTHKQEGENTPDARIYLSDIQEKPAAKSNPAETVAVEEEDGIPF